MAQRDGARYLDAHGDGAALVEADEVEGILADVAADRRRLLRRCRQSGRHKLTGVVRPRSAPGYLRPPTARSRSCPGASAIPQKADHIRAPALVVSWGQERSLKLRQISEKEHGPQSLRRPVSNRRGLEVGKRAAFAGAAMLSFRSIRKTQCPGGNYSEPL